MIKKVFFYCIFIFYVSLSFSQDVVDKIVAVVGSHPILHSEILQQTQIIASSRQINPTSNPFVFQSIYDQTLTNMINQMVVLGVAEKDTNIIVSDESVEKALNQRINEFIQQAGSEEAFEKMIGMSLRKVRSEYWGEIRNMLFIEQYKFSLLQNINISRLEVETFYITYKDSLPIIPEYYDFSTIELPHSFGEISKKKAYVFLDSLKNLIINKTQDFDFMAQKYSEDPGSKTNGGRLGFTTRGSLVFEYEEAAYSLKNEEISIPVLSPFGYHLIKLIDRKGEKISSQHILKRLTISSKDKINTKNNIIKIKELVYNDPFVFDSISAEFQNKHNNLSGIYNKAGRYEIPKFILNNLNIMETHTMSNIIETDGGYCLLFLYNHEKEYVPTLKNSWNLIYQYALQEKQGRMFKEHVDKMKNKIFIRKY